MTPARLAEIRARAQSATLGPWERHEGYITCTFGILGADAHVVCGLDETVPPNENDWAFILAARQDVPDLLADNDRLLAALVEIAATDCLAECILGPCHCHVGMAKDALAGRPVRTPAEDLDHGG